MTTKKRVKYNHNNRSLFSIKATKHLVCLTTKPICICTRQRSTNGTFAHRTLYWTISAANWANETAIKSIIWATRPNANRSMESSHRWIIMIFIYPYLKKKLNSNSNKHLDKLMKFFDISVILHLIYFIYSNSSILT